MADPNAEVTVNGVWTATLYINDAVQLKGTSERYCLGVAAAGADTATAAYVMTPAAAATRAANLLTARARLLGLECLIVWARLSYVISGRALGRRLINGSISQTLRTAESPGTPANSIGDYVKYRFETPSGRHANRDFRGLRDTDVTASMFTIADTEPTYVGTPGVIDAPSSTTDPMTAALQWYNFLYLINRTTFRCHPYAGNSRFKVEPWLNWSLMSAGTKSMGPPFGVSRPKRRIRATGRTYFLKVY